MRQNEYLLELSSKQPRWPFLTIIIPTFNESAYLPELLDALCKQTRQADEIIVADAGSTDGTVELAISRGAKVVPGGMPAVGRNAGAREAKGDYLLFLDADVVPAPDFIARLLAGFEQKDYDIATCFISAIDEHPLDRVICEGTNFYFWMIQPVSPHAPGFCILSKRAKHEALGGFDETLTLSEDIDYARRAKRAGKFGIITSARIPVSMRRIGKEGLVGLGLKYAWCEMYAFAGKPVRKPPFTYEFGKFMDDQEATHRSFIKVVSFHQPLKKIGEPVQKVSNLIRGQLDL
jgi:glycosyltransferase involved in cell wall biosynthesis